MRCAVCCAAASSARSSTRKCGPELGFVGTHAEMNRSASSRRTNNLDWLAKRMVRA
jgi:hypothetical protein